MRKREVTGCLALTILLACCQSQSQKKQQALQSARSWIADIAFTCATARAGALPAHFVKGATTEARKKLKKSIAPLSNPAQQKLLQSAAAFSCNHDAAP